MAGQLLCRRISPNDATLTEELLRLKKDQRVKFSGHSEIGEATDREGRESAVAPIVIAVDQLKELE